MTIEINSPTYGCHIVFFDDADADLIRKYKWRLFKGAKTFYATAHTPMINGKRTTVKMHKLLLPKSSVVDHINGNGLDNRRENLRACSQKQNCQNRIHYFRSGKTSQYKGVMFWKYGKLERPWHARITVNNKHISLGFFATEYEAAVAYNQAALQYFGTFASLNKLEER